MGGFDTRLLKRVAQAVEAGEVPADLLTELQGEIEACREKPPEEGYAQAVHIVVEVAGISSEEAEEMLATLEAQPSVTRELFMRQIAEGWLEGQRGAYQRHRERE